MGRASNAAAARHRAEIVAGASRLIRERGLSQVAIPEVMATAGLTHGGFYRHFESKDALAVEALNHAQTASTGLMERIGGAASSHDDAIRTFVAFYLSDRHRSNLAGGCPYAAMAGDIARQPDDSALRTAFGEGFERNVAEFAAMGSGDLGAPTDREIGDAALEYATLMGITLMARATAGTPISEQLLAAARARFLGEDAGE